ncbi:MAG: isoprenylcysteine carboxylmethyltransferase family protein [Rhizomicrobium sp.]|nr:isoprenylcysteine carboxylmethyltransferase family protein [Rhizomicrobium sp.]
MAKISRLKRIVWLALIAAALFVPAGTLAWPGAWIFLLCFIGGMLLTMAWLKRHDPELFHERVRRFRQSDQPLWDQVLGLGIVVVWYGWLAAMGFEARGAGPTPVAALSAGAALIIVGYFLTAASLGANRFAVTAVRLQRERRQSVMDKGPYAVVRHPMYAASITIHLGTALLLGAGWGFAGVVLLAFLLGLRAVLEEGLLCAGLPGYRDYTARVRWRLIPGLW